MKNIIIKPEKEHLYSEQFLFILIGVFSIIFLVSDDVFIKTVSFLAMCCCVLSIFVFWLWLQNLKWVITEETLEIYSGILNKNKDMLELYRVVDYQETQSFIQRIFGIKNLIIHSTDRNNKRVVICGVKENNTAIDIIRERVEYNKQLKRVYEISNR